MIKIHTVLCREGTMDNYAYILTDEATGTTAVLDPSEAEPIIKKCEELGLKPAYILNTHHHFDHTEGNLELKEKYGAKVVGAAKDAHRIPGIDIMVEDKGSFDLGESRAEIIAVPGHTTGHILWYFPESRAVFTGDMLFNLCIGGLFEGSPRQMWQSVLKIKNLPDDTLFYPGHEYTAQGASFAKYTLPNEPELDKYILIAQQKTAQGHPVFPLPLKLEKLCNPYLRARTEEEFLKLF